jgi:hypothetical protein
MSKEKISFKAKTNFSLIIRTILISFIKNRPELLVVLMSFISKNYCFIFQGFQNPSIYCQKYP